LKAPAPSDFGDCSSGRRAFCLKSEQVQARRLLGVAGYGVVWFGLVRRGNDQGEFASGLTKEGKRILRCPSIHLLKAFGELAANGERPRT
jgi:hypothetical protein